MTTTVTNIEDEHPTPAQMRSKPKTEMVHDPDRFLRQAKEVVVTNYNLHRDVGRSPELSMEGVYIVSFTKTRSDWSAVVASPIIRGLMWTVSYSGLRHETQLDVFKKLKNIRLPDQAPASE